MGGLSPWNGAKSNGTFWNWHHTKKYSQIYSHKQEIFSDPGPQYLLRQTCLMIEIETLLYALTVISLIQWLIIDHANCLQEQCFLFIPPSGSHWMTHMKISFLSPAGALFLCIKKNISNDYRALMCLILCDTLVYHNPVSISQKKSPCQTCFILTIWFLFVFWRPPGYIKFWHRSWIWIKINIRENAVSHGNNKWLTVSATWDDFLSFIGDLVLPSHRNIFEALFKNSYRNVQKEV